MIYHRVFQEHTPAFVAHSAATRRLVDFPPAMDGLGAQFDEAYQAFAYVSTRVQAGTHRVALNHFALIFDHRL